MERLSAKEYRKQFTELEEKTSRLKKSACARLYNLTVKYPNVKLPTSRAGDFRCENISHPWIIEDYDLNSIILFIETIEKHIEKKHPHKQTEINFDNN